jgi:hypothetical protein
MLLQIAARYIRQLTDIDLHVHEHVQNRVGQREWSSAGMGQDHIDCM